MFCAVHPVLLNRPGLKEFLTPFEPGILLYLLCFSFYKFIFNLASLKCLLNGFVNKNKPFDL